MTAFERKLRSGWRGGAQRRLLGALALVFVWGCDGLLEVDIPGDVSAADLNDAALAPVLVRGAQSDFDCALGNYVFTLGLWTADLNIATGARGHYEAATRSPDWFRSASGACSGDLNIMLPLHTARIQAVSAIDIISALDNVPNEDVLIAEAYAYEGYATQLLSEAFCEITFDSGPIETRETGFERAIDRFTSAIEFADKAGGTQAAAIKNMALVGRARANLQLGNSAQVVADAGQVPMSFVRTAQYSDASIRRYNKVFNLVDRTRGYPINARWVGLTTDGVPDPRVRLVHYGRGTGFDGVTDMWGQTKYPSLSSPIPFATGREAKLMIAEVVGGQTAVGIINELRATHALPPFSSSDAVAIREQVRTERNRELFLQGTRLGDYLRWDLELPQGVNQRGDPYNPLFSCVPLEGAEIDGNPNT